MRIVCDPNVLVAALLSQTGAPRRIVEHWAEGLFEIIVSDGLLAELERVLQGPKFEPYVTDGDIEDLLDQLASSGIRVDDPEPEPGLTTDPGDDYLVGLARAARAEVLVSGDRHLLSLTGSVPAVMSPRAFIDALAREGEF